MDNLHEFLKTKINYILSQQKYEISCYIERIAGTREIADISKEGFYNDCNMVLQFVDNKIIPNTTQEIKELFRGLHIVADEKEIRLIIHTAQFYIGPSKHYSIDINTNSIDNLLSRPLLSRISHKEEFLKEYRKCLFDAISVEAERIVSNHISDLLKKESELYSLKNKLTNDTDCSGGSTGCSASSKEGKTEEPAKEAWAHGALGANVGYMIANGHGAIACGVIGFSPLGAASFIESAKSLAISELEKENGTEKQDTTYLPKIEREATGESSIYDKVYSSVFAPAEVKKKSNMLTQIYLHLKEDSETVKSLSKEADKNATRRDYIPLSVKLKHGDIVDVEFNINGATSLMSKRKSFTWQGDFLKYSFNYFIPEDIDIEELNCEANVFVNGAMVGEMMFNTKIVESPKDLNPEVRSHCFNKVFISYAHEDIQQVKFIALAYQAQGVEYFYDRHNLSGGDVFEEKIFDYIDKADLFILCWSRNAAVSEYVAKEKAHAMMHAYPQVRREDATIKIHPISIEPYTDLPDDMIKIYNFDVI